MNEKTYYGRGRRGLVYTASWKGKKVLVKEHNPKSVSNTIVHEANILAIVNKHGIGPKLIDANERHVIMEFIEGEEFLVWVRDKEKKEVVRVLREVLRQCRILDELGISKKELTRPYKHILIRDGKPVQIDFDRAKEMLRPQNVTQLVQWFTKSRISPVLEAKGIHVDIAQLRELTREYKETYDRRTYIKIENLLQV